MAKPKMNRREYNQTAKLTARRGTECPNAKLDDAAVAAIRRLHARKVRLVNRLNKDYSAKGLARRFGVHHRTIEKVLQNVGWIHVRPG